MRLSEEDFDRIVKRSIRRIPREIRRHLDNILISIQGRPDEELLEEMGIPADEPLLGLFTGVPQVERSVTDPPLFPDTIFLFQEPLEEMCATMEELEEEIEITVVHEIAHALGIDEERLAELGYD
jgi:predicted Zn-dependent protease with MMP-like domain